MVDVSADLNRVRVRLDGKTIADHARAWARSTTTTDPAHVETAHRLREQFRAPRTAATAADDLARDLVRDLADYDRAFGLLDSGPHAGEVA